MDSTGMAVCPSCRTENPGAAKFCLECGAALVRAASGGDERKLVTIVFADVAGSTALSERLDAEALKDVMQRFFAAMRAEIEMARGKAATGVAPLPATW
jgi:class 3 adenylate cyclase